MLGNLGRCHALGHGCIGQPCPVHVDAQPVAVSEQTHLGGGRGQAGASRAAGQGAELPKSLAPACQMWPSHEAREGLSPRSQGTLAPRPGSQLAGPRGYKLQPRLAFDFTALGPTSLHCLRGEWGPRTSLR